MVKGMQPHTTYDRPVTSTIDPSALHAKLYSLCTAQSLCTGIVFMKPKWQQGLASEKSYWYPFSCWNEALTCFLKKPWHLLVASFPSTQTERSCVSLSSLDQKVFDYFFVYDVINGFLMVVLGGGTFQQIGSAVKREICIQICNCSICG